MTSAVWLFTPTRPDRSASKASEAACAALRSSCAIEAQPFVPVGRACFARGRAELHHRRGDAVVDGVVETLEFARGDGLPLLLGEPGDAIADGTVVAHQVLDGVALLRAVPAVGGREALQLRGVSPHRNADRDGERVEELRQPVAEILVAAALIPGQ